MKLSFHMSPINHWHGQGSFLLGWELWGKCQEEFPQRKWRKSELCIVKCLHVHFITAWHWAVVHHSGSSKSSGSSQLGGVQAENQCAHPFHVHFYVLMEQNHQVVMKIVETGRIYRRCCVDISPMYDNIADMPRLFRSRLLFFNFTVFVYCLLIRFKWQRTVYRENKAFVIWFHTC